MARAIATENARHMSRDDLVEFYIDECTQSIDEYDKQKDIERRYNLLTQASNRVECFYHQHEEM